jgi:hypothetical protein
LLRLVVTPFAPAGELIFGLDDTLERRRGEHITAKGIYRDPVRSSHSHVVKARGLRWRCCMSLVKIPWGSSLWALPFLTVLCPSERYHAARGRRHQKLPERARQIMRLLTHWLRERRLIFVWDSGFAVLALLHAVRQTPHACVITRLRLDAEQQRLDDLKMPWTTIAVAPW